MKLLSEGAEARILRDGDAVLKERMPKAYRLPELDARLRGTRTRREAKILERLAADGLPVPAILQVDEDAALLRMAHLDGIKLRDVLDQKPEQLSLEMGRLVGKLHAKDIVHQDLTTSNLMMVGQKMHLIDFGLSFTSKKIEDKAVDLHLLDRALESRHHTVYSQCLAAVLRGYKETCPDADAIIARLQAVQQRGRNKKK